MNIIVTGASRGIGYETAKLFASKPENRVLVLSRNIEELTKLSKEEGSGNIIPVEFDLSELNSNSDQLIKLIRNTFSHIDILVNNAGYLESAPFDEFDSKAAQQIFDVNYFGPASLIQLLLPLMGFTKRSHVINIGSMGGFQGSSKFPGLSHYSASKAALASLTECLAEEYKEKNIRFNCLALGSVQTEMLNEAFPGFKAQVEPAEMADFIVEFARRGGQFYNGKVLPVAGITT
jgi:3-oxoacyl-[acyl-carrier protein] reductase